MEGYHMKKLTTIAFLGLFLMGGSFELFASFPVVVKKVVQKGDFMPPRGRSKPITEFVIEVERCRKASRDQFEVRVALVDEFSKPVVEIVDLAFDCFGPTTWQEIRLRTDSLPLMDRVTILNPVLALVEDRTTR